MNQGRAINVARMTQQEAGMAYKNILVHVDADKHASARTDFAAMLALGWGAHLTGLHIAVPTRLPGFVQAELGPEFLEISRRADLAT